jgi:hypothetical protein
MVQAVNSLVSGLGHVSEEIKQLKRLRSSSAGDRFIDVMEVKSATPRFPTY